MPKIDNGGLAFPVVTSNGVLVQDGLSRRDWFAAHAPEPRPEDIQLEADRDRNLNPHGDTYKPERRERLEIITDLRYKYADAMITASKREPR